MKITNHIDPSVSSGTSPGLEAVRKRIATEFDRIRQHLPAVVIPIAPTTKEAVYTGGHEASFRLRAEAYTRAALRSSISNVSTRTGVFEITVPLEDAETLFVQAMRSVE
jgi:hypothetical protein